MKASTQMQIIFRRKASGGVPVSCIIVLYRPLLRFPADVDDAFVEGNTNL